MAVKTGRRQGSESEKRAEAWMDDLKDHMQTADRDKDKTLGIEITCRVTYKMRDTEIVSGWVDDILEKCQEYGHAVITDRKIF